MRLKQSAEACSGRGACRRTQDSGTPLQTSRPRLALRLAGVTLCRLPGTVPNGKAEAQRGEVAQRGEGALNAGPSYGTG